jgi:hypothetical protein
MPTPARVTDCDTIAWLKECGLGADIFRMAGGAHPSGQVVALRRAREQRARTRAKSLGLKVQKRTGRWLLLESQGTVLVRVVRAYMTLDQLEHEITRWEIQHACGGQG